MSNTPEPQPSTETDPVTVDGFVPARWPAEAKIDLARWKQSDLVRQPVLTWSGPLADDPITGVAAGGFAWEAVVDDSLVVPYGVICSQTCDIGAAGPGSVHPFVDIAPVVRRDDLNKGERQDILQHKRMYLTALTAPPEEGFWVADLRLIVPASKALLLHTEPLNGFATENDRLNFAEALGRKRRRPAVHGSLSEGLPQSLDAYIAEVQKPKVAPPGDWYQKVEQVRLIISGDRLGPDRVTMLVIAEDPLSPDEKGLWRAWRTRAARVLKKDGITLAAIVFTDLDKLSARRYAESLPVGVQALGRPPSW
jgi:hypothetical protein